MGTRNDPTEEEQRGKEVNARSDTAAPTQPQPDTLPTLL